MSLVANRQVGYTVARIATDLRLQLIRATMGARWSTTWTSPVGGLSNAIATEAQRASEAFQFGAEMTAMLVSSVVYLVVAFAISPEAGIAAAIAGALLLLGLRVLIKSSRRAGQRQTDLQKSLLTLIGAQFAAAKPLKAMAREDHVDALLTDETQAAGARAAPAGDQPRKRWPRCRSPCWPSWWASVSILGTTVLKMPMAELVVMLFMLARVVSYLSKSQKAYQQVVVRESAYWSLVAGHRRRA